MGARHKEIWGKEARAYRRLRNPLHDCFVFGPLLFWVCTARWSLRRLEGKALRNHDYIVGPVYRILQNPKRKVSGIARGPSEVSTEKLHGIRL